MAKRNEEDAAAQGFQIPIEDANDESAETAEAEAQEANEANADETGDEIPELDDEEIIAEAEAVVEEAAEGLSAEEQLESAKAKAQEWQDRYMRLHAEWDTYRRRTQDQRAEEKVRATEKLMENLLPVLDDFERTVSYAEENGETGLLDGVKAVQSKLIDALTKGGLQVIDPVGEPYDALEAQAVQVVPDEEAFEETVKDVFQKGYKMGKKVLRAAMVTVTSGGPKRPKEEESNDEE
ncbi:MAG: nucleotide exchange factor GrpE [Eggerthellaceae bacterium]|nr:nucleotide exchange factor GrpE [Eggerthellaceae bacterium]